MRGLLRQAQKRACCLLGVSAVAFAVPLFVCIQVICAGAKVHISGRYHECTLTLTSGEIPQKVLRQLEGLSKRVQRGINRTILASCLAVEQITILTQESNDNNDKQQNNQGQAT